MARHLTNGVSPGRSGRSVTQPGGMRWRMGGLDALNFFVANLQTGFGPFIAVYLTTQTWTEREIGLVLSAATLVSICGQVPGGALVDAMTRKRLAATAALVLIGLSACLIALYPARLAVTFAESLHSLATCILVPAIAAMTLRRVRLNEVAERLGRNARYAALGSAIGAGLMGACGTYVSSRAVFLLAAMICIPALLAVRALPPPRNVAPALPLEPAPWTKGLGVLLDRRLITFGVCVVMFHLSNAAMLPLMASRITATVGSAANIVIAACLVVPQFLVAWLSPWAGWAAERWGRRPVLIAGFMALPLRALAFAAFDHPVPVVIAQALDGVGGAVFGVMMPLICADITRGSQRFNTSVGAIGLGVSLGATLSTTIAGSLATSYGNSTAFLALAAFGALAVAAVAVLMPETRPPPAPSIPSARPSPAA